MPYRKPTSRYFTSTTGSMGGRPYFRLYKGDVSSYTKDRSSAASSFRRKCSCGIRSSIVTMCSFSCIQPTACFFFYSTTADDIFPLCQQPHFVQRCEAAPLGAALRQLSILFLLNPSTETKWRTSYDNDQSERFLLLVLNGRAAGGA